MTIAETADLGFVERMLARYGRTFWLAFFAGTSSFVLVGVALWVVARVEPERGRIIGDLANDYLLAAFGFVLAYAGKNYGVEREHARAGKPAPTSRTSGTVQSGEG